MEKKNIEVKSPSSHVALYIIRRVSGSGLAYNSISDWTVRMNRDATNHEPQLICM